MLFLLIKSLKNNPTLSKFYKLCYVSIFLCMYHAALRISEVAISTSDQHTLLFNCITYDRCSSLLTINFKSYKHSNNELPSIAIKCRKRMSYYAKNYLKARGSHPGYFFCHTDHSPFSRNEIVKVLKEELSRLNYNPAGLGSSTVDQVLKYTKYPKYIPSTITGQVLILKKST